MECLENAEANEALIEIFHSHLDTNSLEEIPKDFSSTNSPVRCLIATIAFGMGMQVSDVSYIIHWGPPSSILDYWQEVGRCARNEKPGSAYLYTPPYSRNTKTIEKPMLDLVNLSTKQCIRKTVLTEMKLKAVSASAIEKCCGSTRCCSFCDKSCPSSD